MVASKAKFRAGIASAAPAIVSPAAFQFSVGDFDFVAVQATGQGTITMSLSGTLPLGLSAADYGAGIMLIGGTPVGAQNVNVIVTARNAFGSTMQTVNVVTAAPPPPGGTFPEFLIPNGIDKTGATDVSAAIQSWINSVPNGTLTTPNILRLRPGATYRVENILWLRYRQNFIIDFNGAQIIANTDGSGLTLPGRFDVRQRAQMIFTCCDNFVVYDPVIRGANPVSDYRLDSIYVDVLELQHALRFAGCTNYEVSGGNLSRTYGDGIYLGFGQLASGVHQLCSKAWIHDTEISTSGRQGISPCGQTDSVFENGYIHHAGRAAFDFEPIGFPAARGGSDPLTFGVFNTHLRGWHFGPHRLSTIAHKGSGLTDGLIIASCYADNATDCQFKSFFGASNFNDGSPGEQRYNLWVVDNNFPKTTSGGGNGAIQMQRYTRAVVARNTMPVQNRAYVQPKLYDNATPRHVIATDPLYIAGREPLVQAAYCTDVTATGNNAGGAPQIRPAWVYTDTPYTPSLTAPAPPDCGALFAPRSVGGWTP